MKEIWINMQSSTCRERMIYALASSGYSVKQVEKEDGYKTMFWVVFSIPENNVKGSEYDTPKD